MSDWKRYRLSATTLFCCSFVLAISRTLQPSIRGLGTHEQLGLPACKFLLLTGIPCPSCGLTTSFAYAAHFQFKQAFLASPFGLALFVVVVLAIPAALLGRRRLSALGFVKSTWFLYSVAAAYLVSWICKIARLSLAGMLVWH